MDADEHDGSARLFRVVVADDAPANRLLIRHVLGSSGAFEVVAEAADGAEVVELATVHQPDLVLLDLYMPHLDGAAAVSQIRSASPRSRIVVVSGAVAGPASDALTGDGGVDARVETRQPPEELLRVALAVCRRSGNGSFLEGQAAPDGQAAAGNGEDPPDPPGGGLGRVLQGPPGTEDPPGESRLAELTEQLDWARADLAIIGATASHDLKSPLQAIMGFAHLLDQLYAGTLDDRGRTFIRTIVDASERMGGLIDELAAYCRAISVPPMAVPVNLAQVTAGVLKSLAAQIAALGASVDVGALPQVVGDPAQLGTVVSSLVANALACGAEVPTVLVSADRTASGWTVSVCDACPGVDVGQQDRLFTLFGRLPQRAGLPGAARSQAVGLAVAKRLVEGWGGSIWIEDRQAGPGGGVPSTGSRICFSIPDRLPAPSQEHAPVTPAGQVLTALPVIPVVSLGPAMSGTPRELGAEEEEEDYEAGAALAAQAPAAAVPPEAAALPPGGEAEAVQQLLLVEDSEPHAQLVAATLAEAPGARYRLHHVSDLAEARHALEGHHVDCVLLDLSLPDSEGLDTLAQMLQMAPAIPVLVLTSRADEALAVASVQQGAQDYIVKGAYEPASLARAIRYAIERKALEAQLAQQALHDALTGLPNRTLLLDRLNPALARASRSGDKLALLYLDLDGFKPINDEFGHEAGDGVLVEVARRLISVVRPQDTVARIGGDEFAIMCEGFRADNEIQSLVLRMADVVAQPIPVGTRGDTRRVTASIGIAFASDRASAEDLIRSADQEMYRMKRRER